MNRPEQKFVHLHTHSHYSLLDGLSKIPALVKKAKSDGMTALALTDHGAMYGSIEFYQECKKAGIKPLIGVEAYIAERSRLDKDASIDSKRYHLTLIARNEVGYKHLMKLVTMASVEGYYYKPRMDHDILRQYGEGIICLSGCPGSRFIHYLKNNQLDEARKLLSFYIECFSKEHVFVEIMKHEEIDWYVPLIPTIISIAKEMDLPIVGTWDAHYLHIEDAEVQDTLVAINTGSEVGASKISMKNGNYSFITSDEAWDAFKEIPDAYNNTQKVADLVDLEIELGKLYFPEYKLENNIDPNDALKKMAYDGVERLEIEKTDIVIKRLEYELDVIKMKGYPSYFLVVADLMSYTRAHGILTNTRGSAAGSFVSYVCGITNINPLDYDLPFERFLNPFRPSPPDIDMDIADTRRDELIEYARKKYGEENVAQIGTFGTMMARGAVRDVARALGYPYNSGDRISKLIPMGAQGAPMTIDKALEIVPELKEMYDTEREVGIIINMARKIEGCARHISVHAAGVVISPRPMTEFTPVQFDPKGGKLITQYDMYSIEDAGLPKFDFLGIRNLSFLAESIELVKTIYSVDIDINKIPLDDKKTYMMLARGETEGVFQLNGGGMTKILKELKPTVIHDINVMVALYRPGPMQNIDEYVKRKHGKSRVKFYHPKMAKYLGPSLGLLVYQDDLLFTAIELAGYDWDEVDKFRKAVGKKIPEEMAKQHVKFVDGCQSHSGMSKKDAEFIWTLFEPFQGYGFNKAHAASYGRVAYQTAYMKANFPVAYMTAMMTAESGDIETIGIYVAECRRMGIAILPPDINESFGGFSIAPEKDKPLVESRTIRFGLYTIKNLGVDISDAIIAERKNGPYKSLLDFLTRVTHKNVNKKSLEALTKTGALDAFGERGQLLANMERLLNFNKDAVKTSTQTSLFSFNPELITSHLDLEEATAATNEEKLLWEKDLLGLYISGHPLDRIKEKVLALPRSSKEMLVSGKADQVVMLAGIIETVRAVFTKKQDQMAFVKIADYDGSIEVVFFPKLFVTVQSIIKPDVCLLIKGKISVRNGEKSIIADQAKVI